MANGRKTGGRMAGTPNRATAAKVAEIEASGMAPLDFMLSVMRDEENDLDRRLEAAKAAAPYVHPKLSAIEHAAWDGGGFSVSFRTIYEATDEQLEAIAFGENAER